MSKNVGFPVMSTGFTGILFVLGLLCVTLGILVAGLTASLGATNVALIRGLLSFIGLLLFLWALLSYSLNPDLEDYQRNVAFLFLVLIVVILFRVGLLFTVTVG